ncbi:carbohydrate ABC transporter permease [Mahella sp.]|uniref:carbohydrate ABC transporter permease n=1 Tax=Mahella sp. TaxID=2798721 RepID=UPI0025C276D9|nr:carbohydrate ABC transporter permease [Mahella sp.]MBZ4665993.1 transporter, permease protein [Mahella sp.]MDK2903799.1 multiple sugar transport system permease protein [Clostridiales bacterium]
MLMGYANKKKLIKIVLTVFMAVLAILMVLPFAWMLSASFKPDSEVFNFPIEWIPKTFTWENYIKVWASDIPFPTFFMNSVKVTVLAVIGEVCTSALAGYAFAKIKFKGRDLAFLIYVSTLMFPSQMMLIPRFVLFKTMGIYNTHWALILPGMFTAFGTFMLKQFFESIPEELTESARMDGANHFIIFTRIVLPLSTAALSALIIFQFVSMWNEYEPALVYLRDVDLATIPLGLKYFQDESSTSYGAVMAASVCSLVPIFIIFLTFQRQFVQGIAISGLKE